MSKSRKKITVAVKRKNGNSILLKQIESGLKDVAKIQSGKVLPKTLTEILNGK